MVPCLSTLEHQSYGALIADVVLLLLYLVCGEYEERVSVVRMYLSVYLLVCMKKARLRRDQHLMTIRQGGMAK